MWCEGQRQAVAWESRAQTVGARAQTMYEEGRHLWRQQLGWVDTGTGTSSSVKAVRRQKSSLCCGLWAPLRRARFYTSCFFLLPWHSV